MFVRLLCDGGFDGGECVKFPAIVKGKVASVSEKRISVPGSELERIGFLMSCGESSSLYSFFYLPSSGGRWEVEAEVIPNDWPVLTPSHIDPQLDDKFRKDLFYLARHNARDGMYVVDDSGDRQKLRVIKGVFSVGGRDKDQVYGKALFKFVTE